MWWGQVEPSTPHAYDWRRVRAALELAREAGLKAKVAFNFHAGAEHALPAWVRASKFSDDALS